MKFKTLININKNHNDIFFTANLVQIYSMNNVQTIVLFIKWLRIPTIMQCTCTVHTLLWDNRHSVKISSNNNLVLFQFYKFRFHFLILFLGKLSLLLDLYNSICYRYLPEGTRKASC